MMDKPQTTLNAIPFKSAASLGAENIPRSNKNRRYIAGICKTDSYHSAEGGCLFRIK